MPRPKRPERVRGALAPDKHLAAPIATQVDALIDDYLAQWKPEERRGRRNETKSGRNALFNDLARLFHNYSTFAMSISAESDESETFYIKRYRVALKGFLSRILVANQIPYPVQVVTRFQYIERRYHSPRD